jgi:hypothetical protein
VILSKIQKKIEKQERKILKNKKEKEHLAIYTWTQKILKA